MAIVVPIVADTSGLTRSLTKGSTGIAKFGKVAALAAGAAGVGALVATVRVGIDEFMEQEKVIAQTNAVLKSTKGIANVTAKEISNLSESLMKKTGIDDEAIQSGQNLLLTFTKVRNEVGKGNDIFDQATVLMTDLSVAMGKDMSSSAMLVGKALNDPVKGVSALSRAGVQFTASQKETIKAMVESGNVMGAQKMILKELETQFGGSANAAGKTLGGQLNILKQSFSNLAGELVATFMPTVTRAATRVVDFLTKFSEQPTLTAKIKFLVSSIGEVAWNGISSIYEWWNKRADRVELPARVVLVNPGGKQQLEDLIAELEPKSREAGRAVGKAIAAGILEGSLDGVKEKMSARWSRVLRFLVDPLGVTSEWLGRNIINPFIGGMVSQLTEDLAPALAEAIRGAIDTAVNLVKGPGGFLGRLTEILPNGGPRTKALTQSLANVFTKSFRDAVKSARESLVSGGSSLASLLSERVSVGFRVDGTGKNSKEMVAAQRDLEDRRFKIEEQRLRDALAIAEDQTEAQLALDEFLLQKEATLRQRGVDDANASNTQQINDLVAAFNRGEETAKTFSDKLNGIIGAAPGADLGGAFAGAFDTQLQTVLGTAQDIFDTISGSLALTGGSGLMEALKQSNDERFKAYAQRWESRRDALQDRIDDAKEVLDDEDSSEKEKAAARKRLKTAQDALAAHRARKKDRAAFGMALGGILKKQVFTAGEAGPEAVMPLSGRGGVMLRDALGMNERQGSTYNITVNAGMGASGTDLGREIVEAIKKYERTNGNVFASA